MALISIKAVILPLAIVVFLLFTTGVLSYEKLPYSCLEGQGGYERQNRVELFTLGSFHIYGYPYVQTCPDDARFDPKTGVMCGLRCGAGSEDLQTVDEEQYSSDNRE